VLHGGRHLAIEVEKIGPGERGEEDEAARDDEAIATGKDR
jgi:hypothetical protein